ncbi:hypothetical protein TRVA0_046S00166 [Trichomonascus vanleenenianus]|uniref:C2H2-type zinc finger protein n=1 Tax=Trichomonascus vanleenenianus TaxID=2268995 RepID=UPI003ECA41B4
MLVSTQHFQYPTAHYSANSSEGNAFLEDKKDPALSNSSTPPVGEGDGSPSDKASLKDYSALDALTMAAAAAVHDNSRHHHHHHHHQGLGESKNEVMRIASLTNPSPEHGGGKTARKKKQCSECNGWFSNLATHKSIHMSEHSRPHTCNVCGRGFARPNDLIRHQKSHQGDAPFRCPLFTKHNTTPSHPGQHSSQLILEPACHQNGGFSRCDTYKNHLKAMHFDYPPGTKKRDRAGVSGKCKGCGDMFETADEWIATHIETGQCDGIKRIRILNEQYQTPVQPELQ